MILTRSNFLRVFIVVDIHLLESGYSEVTSFVNPLTLLNDVYKIPVVSWELTYLYISHLWKRKIIFPGTFEGDMLGELQGTFWPYTFRDFQGQIEIHFDKMEKRPTWPANFDGDWWDLEDFQLFEHMLFTYYTLWYVILYIHINSMWALIDVLWFCELLLIRYNMYVISYRF